MPKKVDQWSRDVRKYHSHMVPKLAPVTLLRPKNQKNCLAPSRLRAQGKIFQGQGGARHRADDRNFVARNLKLYCS